MPSGRNGLGPETWPFEVDVMAVVRNLDDAESYRKVQKIQAFHMLVDIQPHCVLLRKSA